MKRTLFVVAFIIIIANLTYGQVYTNKEVGKKNEALIDSIKAVPYPYSLPIWGAKATAKRYSLPYLAGISVNYFQQESSIIIDNLYVGFNNGPMYDLNEIVRFNDATASAGALTVRPDVWILPFLNVYAVLGKVKSSTEISVGIWIPDTANIWEKFSRFQQKQTSMQLHLVSV